MTLYETLLPFAKSKNPALYFRSITINHKQLVDRVDQMADVLFQLGIRKDTVVSLLAPNVPETVIALYALNKIGAIVSILHPLLPSEVFRQSIRETKSSFVLLLDARYKDYKDVLLEEKVPFFFLSPLPDLRPFIRTGFRILYHKDIKDCDKSLYLFRKKPSSCSFAINRDSRKPSIYLRSGGTTGSPKTVVLNDSEIEFDGTMAEETLGRPIPGISMIGLLPLFHGFGLAVGVVDPLMNDAASCLIVSYNGKEICRKIRQNKLNVLITVPYMTDKLLATPSFRGRKLRNLYATFIGADKPEERLFSAFDKRMEEANSSNRLLEGYGMTETVAYNFVNTAKEERIPSVGKAVPGVRIKIVSPDNHEEELPFGVDGQILISSPSVCLGYLGYKDEEQPFLYDSKKEKWLLTGDIGHLDKDGYLFFQNRKNDVYKIAGYYVFPSDIEEKANEVEGVLSSAALYTKEAKHPYFTLYVEGKEGIDEPETEKRIKAHLSRYLLRYSVPEKIVFLKKMPRTSLGKIDRKMLSETKN